MLILLITAIIGIVLDIYTKYLAVTNFKVNETEIIKDAFYFTYVENRGAAFGIMQNMQWLFIILTGAVLIAIVAYVIVKKPQSKLLLLSLGGIVGGGIGNLIDRIRLGYVIDFIDVRIINYPVFNVADCFVVGGCILLCVYILFFSDKNRGI